MAGRRLTGEQRGDLTRQMDGVLSLVADIRDSLMRGDETLDLMIDEIEAAIETLQLSLKQVEDING